LTLEHYFGNVKEENSNFSGREKANVRKKSDNNGTSRASCQTGNLFDSKSE
jgi:hypothetical protein